MLIQSSEIINLLFSIVLLVVAWRREVDIILLILFIYGSLYYCSSLAPLFAGWSVVKLIEVHRFQGSGLLAKISAIFFLMVIFIRLGIRLVNLPDWNRQLMYLFLAVIAAVFLGYLVSLKPGDLKQLQNLISLEFMLVLMFLGSRGLGGSGGYSLPKPYPWTIIKGLSLLALLVGFYEVFSLRAWANFQNSSGELIYRASSLLYNPNLFGIWGAIVTLSFAFAIHQGIGNRLNFLLWLVISSAGVLLSGSRSAIFLLLIGLWIAALLGGQMKSWRRWQPLVLVVLTFLGISAVAKLLERVAGANQQGWHAIKLLVDRAWSAPLLLAKYLLFSAQAVPAEVAVAIEGRFSGGTKDSGLWVLYDDTGWLGVGSFVLLGLVFFVCGIRAYLVRRDVASSYALAILIFCTGVGVVMRYQVFPVWLFVGVILAPCLALWCADPPADRGAEERLT